MAKLRKVRRRKKFRYNINRKRLRNKINNCGKISCKEIADQWERQKSFKTNIKEMGLSINPNECVKINNNHKPEEKINIKTPNDDEWYVETEEVQEDIPASKKIVAEMLLKEAKAPRAKGLRLPGSVVEWVTYLMDKYGSDYKAMARDKKNRDQETWKQIRRKIKLFKNIEEQYSEYLRKRGIQSVESDFSSDGEL